MDEAHVFERTSGSILRLTHDAEIGQDTPERGKEVDDGERTPALVALGPIGRQ